MAFSILSPAKINLFLRVVGRRDDGFHDIESLFAYLDLYDQMSFEFTNSFELLIEGQFAPMLKGRSKLLLDIFLFFKEKFNLKNSFRISLIKNIPVGGGLGGGSSNAASLIKAINHMFELELSKEELQKISLEFGSDIPFFFEDHACFVGGRGEKLKPLNLSQSEIDCIIVNPFIESSTANIFKRFSNLGKFSSKLLSNPNLQDSFELKNDLETMAVAAIPAISLILQEMKNLGAKYAKMSGSGSTCFAIFDNQRSLDESIISLRRIFPSFFIQQSKILLSSNIKSNLNLKEGIFRPFGKLGDQSES